MIEKVKRVQKIERTRLYKKQHPVFQLNSTSELSMLLSNMYSIEQFKAIVGSWSTIKLELELKIPVFCINQDKIKILKSIIQSKGLSCPNWL